MNFEAKFINQNEKKEKKMRKTNKKRKKIQRNLLLKNNNSFPDYLEYSHSLFALSLNKIHGCDLAT